MLHGSPVRQGRQPLPDCRTRPASDSPPGAKMPGVEKYRKKIVRVPQTGHWPGLRLSLDKHGGAFAGRQEITPVLNWALFFARVFTAAGRRRCRLGRQV
jgi:hypothetical protein